MYFLMNMISTGYAPSILGIPGVYIYIAALTAARLTAHHSSSTVIIFSMLLSDLTISVCSIARLAVMVTTAL